MPFEPLNTDEQLPKSVKREPDMDTQMLGGCTAFVSSSLLSYALAVWPFFVWSNSYLLKELGVSALFGMLPSAILAAYSSRKTGIPGACGCVAGAMATSIFLFLRLKQMAMGFESRDFPLPDYPPSFVWLVPIAWIVATATIALLMMPKVHFVDKPLAPENR